MPLAAARLSAPFCGTSKPVIWLPLPLPTSPSVSTTPFPPPSLPKSSATTATASPPWLLAPIPLASLPDPSIAPSNSTSSLVLYSFSLFPVNLNSTNWIKQHYLSNRNMDSTMSNCVYVIQRFRNFFQSCFHLDLITHFYTIFGF